MELNLKVPVGQLVFLHKVDDLRRLNLSEDGTDVDGTLRLIAFIDGQGLVEVGFIADDELQDVLRTELFKILPASGRPCPTRGSYSRR